MLLWFNIHSETIACSSHSDWSFSHFIYDKAIKNLQKLLEEVSSNEKTIEKIEDSNYEDLCSNHHSKSEEKCNSSEDGVFDGAKFFNGKG